MTTLTPVDLPPPLERAFETRWRQLAGQIQLVREYRFHPTRWWRLDFAYPAAKVGIELHGATYSRGRHVRGKGFANDREKINAALAAGWIVFELTSDMLRRDPATCIEQIVGAIEQRAPVVTG